MSGAPSHRAVLKGETIAALAPQDGGLYVDATFGAGGISRALLESADCAVIAIDRDPAAIERAAHIAHDFGGRFEIRKGTFGTLEMLLRPMLAARGREHVDGVTFDLGVSSPQLDEAERGFSFRSDGPLDMRMSGEGTSAADLVNSLSETELARVISRFGEELHARRIARAIIAERAKVPITRTVELARIVEETVHSRPGERIHPATRTFQALRIAVNEELKELALGLAAAERLLKEAGRLAVVTFHSLEDRIVKLFLAERSRPRPAPSRHVPARESGPWAASFRVLAKRPIVPTAAETAENPRARSAKLRVAERTGAQSHPLDSKLLALVE